MLSWITLDGIGWQSDWVFFSQSGCESSCWKNSSNGEERTYQAMNLNVKRIKAIVAVILIHSA